jgi:uncharacterized integral membrane protein (TIGR00698 family)
MKTKLPGILLCAAIAAIATLLSHLHIGNFSLDLVGAPVFAILLGMIITMAVPPLASMDTTKDGIRFTTKKILQYAVIILGFSLNLGTIASVGSMSLPVIVSTISTSLLVAYILHKALRMNGKIATLIGVGSSICGGSAIAATAPVIDADDEQIAQSISVIFFFNVIAALIFPTLGHAIGLGSEGFAVFAGTAVNDTSSVTAAAATAESIYGTDGILSAAVTVKLTRTLAIIPITLVLAIYHTSRRSRIQDQESETGSYSVKSVFPFFILFFIGASLITTLAGLLPAGAFAAGYMDGFVPVTKWLARFFIAMAMCAIGLNTNLVELVRKGGKPILLGFCCWCAITAVSIGVQLLTGIFYTDL